MWFVVHARGDRTFRVPLHASGVSEFLDRCERHLPATALLCVEAGSLVLGRSVGLRAVDMTLADSRSADSPLWDPEVDSPLTR